MTWPLTPWYPAARGGRAREREQREREEAAEAERRTIEAEKARATQEELPDGTM